MAILDSDPPTSTIVDGDVDTRCQTDRDNRLRILIEDVVMRRIVPELLARQRDIKPDIAPSDTVISFTGAARRQS